jgi:hypothetical protein
VLRPTPTLLATLPSTIHHQPLTTNTAHAPNIDRRRVQHAASAREDTSRAKPPKRKVFNMDTMAATTSTQVKNGGGGGGRSGASSGSAGAGAAGAGASAGGSVAASAQASKLRQLSRRLAEVFVAASNGNHDRDAPIATSSFRIDKIVLCGRVDRLALSRALETCVSF